VTHGLVLVPGDSGMVAVAGSKLCGRIGRRSRGWGAWIGWRPLRGGGAALFPLVV
jgi:hypothetical protein